MGFLKKVIGVPNALLRALAEKLIVGRLQDIGSGKYGQLAQRIYDAVKGKKTFVGFALGLMAFVLMALGNDAAAATILGSIGGVLVAAGLADKAVNSPGRPDWLADNGLYKLAVDNAGLLTTALGAGFTYVTGAACTAYVIHGYTFTCATQGQALLVVAAALAYVKVIDVSFLAQTPASIKANGKV